MAITSNCMDCGIPISNSNGQRKRCKACVKNYNRIYMREYMKNYFIKYGRKS